MTAIFWNWVLYYLVANHDDLDASSSSEC